MAQNTPAPVTLEIPDMIMKRLKKLYADQEAYVEAVEHFYCQACENNDMAQRRYNGYKQNLARIEREITAIYAMFNLKK